MSTSRVLYRLRQFRLALGAALAPEGVERARALLTATQFELFARLLPSEQAHSLQVLAKLETAGQTQPELLKAALLHDIGKSRFHLKVWERVEIVLFKAATPGIFRRLGATPIESASRWVRPFVIAEQHPAWGAELAEEAGASDLMAALIRRHQDKVSIPQTLEDRLLCALQAVDDES